MKRKTEPEGQGVGLDAYVCEGTSGGYGRLRSDAPSLTLGDSHIYSRLDPSPAS
jgi:hypothetical protein